MQVRDDKTVAPLNLLTDSLVAEPRPNRSAPDPLAGHHGQREINCQSILDNFDTTTTTGRYFARHGVLANMEWGPIIGRTGPI